MDSVGITALFIRGPPFLIFNPWPGVCYALISVERSRQEAVAGLELLNLAPDLNVGLNPKCKIIKYSVNSRRDSH